MSKKSAKRDRSVISEVARPVLGIGGVEGDPVEDKRRVVVVRLFLRPLQPAQGAAHPKGKVILQRTLEPAPIPALRLSRVTCCAFGLIRIGTRRVEEVQLAGLPK